MIQMYQVSFLRFRQKLSPRTFAEVMI